MPTFYTDPRITYQGLGPDPNEALSRFFQLKLLAEDRAAEREDRAERRRMQGIQEREALLRLKALEQQAGEQAAVRGAMSAGVRPGLQVPQGREGRLGVDIPASFDRRSALAALAQSEGAHLLPGIEADFAAQDAKMQQAAIETAKQLAQLSNEQFKQVKETSDYLDSQITGFLGLPAEQRPALWPQVRAQQPPQIQQLMPEQYPGDEWLIQQATGSQEWKRIVDAQAAERAATETARHNKAQEGLTRRGQDIRPDPSVVIQTVDAQGNPVTRIVPKVAGSEFAARTPASRAGVAQAQERAMPVIQQMETLSKQINLGSGVSAVVTGRARSAMGAANYDTAVAQYEALVSGAVPLVARALGHTGVLTEQDVESTRNLFPRVGDSQELAESKWKVVHAIIKGQGTTSAAPPGTVRMIAPDGSEADVPEAQVAAAEAAGAKRKQ